MPAKRDNLPALTVQEKAAIKVAQREAAKKVAEERKLEAKIAAAWAATVWNKCEPCTEHEYLTRKRIQPHGTRILSSVDGITLDGLDDSNHYRLNQAVGALVVPMHDEHGNVCGIQFVYPTGHPRKKKIERDKEFWPSGMAMGGTFGVIGPVRRSGVMLITEGFATGASLHEATGQSVAYAFSANNLAKAAKIIRKKNPKLRLLFCADDDYLTDHNPGVTAAVAAHAEFEHSSWIKPDFTGPDGDLRDGKKLTDFNDLAILTGSPLALADQINAKLDSLEWRDNSTFRGAPANEGGGGNGRRAAVSVMSLDEAVSRFVPLDDGTGKYLFDTWTNKVAHKDQMLALLPAGVRGDDVKRHPEWQSRGAYYLDQVGFDPSGKDGNVKLNTWQGWDLQPVEGECAMILKTLEHLCGKEANGREIYQWILKWMAYPLQHPGAKMKSAVILHGPQGTGKSLIFRTLAAIYGRYATVIGNRAIEDKFNSDWSDSKLFILAEEVATSADKWQIKNELKELVTGETVRINPKNIAAYEQKNQMNMAFLSNEDMPLPLENDDRRHLVVYTPPCLPEEHYISALDERDNGGVEALYHFLLNLPLGDFGRHSRPPMTEAKQNLISLSLSSDRRFVQEWIQGDTKWPICACRSMDLYKAYLKWCKQNGESRPRASNMFLGMVGNMTGWEATRGRVYNDLNFVGKTKPERVVIPSVEILTESGWELPPDIDRTQWLTQSIFEFYNADRDDEGNRMD
jgi:putative DNA primase/helicase